MDMPAFCEIAKRGHEGMGFERAKSTSWRYGILGSHLPREAGVQAEEAWLKQTFTTYPTYHILLDITHCKKVRDPWRWLEMLPRPTKIAGQG